MKIKTEVDLDGVVGYDGETIAQLVCDEMCAEIKRAVKRELKNDGRVEQIIKQLKDSAVEKIEAELTGDRP